MKLSKRMLGIGSAVAVAGALALTGITGAAASGSQPGYIHVTIMGTNPSASAPRSIIVTGSINAGGVDKPGNKVDNAVFPDGSFLITHSKGIGTPRFNPRTCIFQLAQNGTYTLSNGTGAYAGISGHGIYRLNITQVAARNSAGKCTNASAAFQFLVRAQGPVSGA